LAVQRLDSLMRNPHEEFQNSVEAFAVDGSGCKFSDVGFVNGWLGNHESISNPFQVKHGN
jgi:hypothetical protein